MTRRHPHSHLFPYTTLFRSERGAESWQAGDASRSQVQWSRCVPRADPGGSQACISADSVVAWEPCCRRPPRSEEHTSELQSQSNLVCRLLLEKKNRRESDTK